MDDRSVTIAMPDMGTLVFAGYLPVSVSAGITM
jgi:hypothetical protein